MSKEINHGNLRNKPAFNALVPSTRIISTLLKRGPYTGRLYQDMIEKILNSDRQDVILLDKDNHHLVRILHADWISEEKYSRDMAKVLKLNNLAVDAKGNLIRLSESVNKEPEKTEDKEPVIDAPAGESQDTQSPEPVNPEPAGESQDTQSPEPTPDAEKKEEVNTNNQKNKYHKNNNQQR